ncbi:MAG: hypothetical protein LBR38_02640 [Synergistaceae bacterium]|jgi:hypothetical protein|nr:hypothetical protein [Synergistaceae bacterium]
MAEITNLGAQLDQSRIGSEAQRTVEGGAAARASAVPQLRSGTVVEGQVLSRNADGSYDVRLNLPGGARTLLARATIDLIVGENFRAVWDSSGQDVPLLRLSQSELSLLTKMPLADREMATAMLARGMPLSGEIMKAVKDAWRRMGKDPEQLGPLLELWARDLPLTEGNAKLLIWYSALSSESANAIWARVKRELKRRTAGGENPVDVLRNLKEGDDDTGRFLRGHSMLLKAPRDDVNAVLLEAPTWPARDDMRNMTARVFLGRVKEEGDRRYWQMGFAVEGVKLGLVGGEAESDGRSYNLNLYAERPDTCEFLQRKRGAIRDELEGVPLALQFIGVSRIIVGGLRRGLLSERGLDITV